MGTLIDSSVLIEAERGRLDLSGLLRGAADQPHAVAALSVSEVMHGLFRAVTEEQRLRRRDFVDYMLREFPVFPFDLRAAQLHAELGAKLSAAGTPVGTHDLIIAATAIANDMQVATRDLRSFPRIPGLSLLQW